MKELVVKSYLLSQKCQGLVWFQWKHPRFKAGHMLLEQPLEAAKQFPPRGGCCRASTNRMGFLYISRRQIWRGIFLTCCMERNFQRNSSCFSSGSGGSVQDFTQHSDRRLFCLSESLKASKEKEGLLNHLFSYLKIPETKYAEGVGEAHESQRWDWKKPFLPLSFKTTLRHFNYQLGKGCTNHKGGAGSSLFGAWALPMASFGCLKPLALIVAWLCLNKHC